MYFMFISPTPTPVWEFNAAQPLHLFGNLMQHKVRRGGGPIVSRVAWPISIHLLSVMGLFCLCFAGGFVGLSLSCLTHRSLGLT